MSESQKHILFVCTGNTCRSPMAEGIFRERFGQATFYSVSSAGLQAASGAVASVETAKILNKRGVDFSSFRSQQLSMKLLEEADYVFCMASHHRDFILANAPEARGKVYLIGELLDHKAPQNIFDPYGMDAKAYQEVERQIDEAMDKILNFLEGH